MATMETLVKRGATTKKSTTKKSGSKLVSGAMHQPDSFTENGAVTYSTSGSACVDLFALAGASRTKSKVDILSLFEAAWNENSETAIKILFWARDIRGGAGERRFFNLCWNWVTSNHASTVRHLVKYIPVYGRWDDVWRSTADSLDEEVLSVVGNGLEDDNGLLAKWLPRKGALSSFFWRGLGYENPKSYRQHIVGLTNVVETQMCNQDWSDINYSHIPSNAFRIYRKAYAKHDKDRFEKFVDAAVKGDVKVNSGAMFPHQLVTPFLNRWDTPNGLDAKAAQAQWNQLPDFVAEGASFLPMVDVSSSMGSSADGGKTSCMAVAVGLGLYLSERNKGIFENAFITFTSKPSMQHTKGSLAQRVKQMTGPVGYDTNFQAAMNLILNTAIEHNLSDEDIPDTLLILSDMEFNDCGSSTNFTQVRKKFKAAGLKCPNIVFWNIQARSNSNQPVTQDTSGTALVSGFSPSIMQYLFGTESFTPEAIMNETVYSERYEPITLQSV